MINVCVIPSSSLTSWRHVNWSTKAKKKTPLTPPRSNSHLSTKLWSFIQKYSSQTLDTKGNQCEKWRITFRSHYFHHRSFLGYEAYYSRLLARWLFKPLLTGSTNNGNYPIYSCRWTSKFLTHDVTKICVNITVTIRFHCRHTMTNYFCNGQWDHRNDIDSTHSRQTRELWWWSFRISFV